MHNIQATVDCLKNMSFESFVVGTDARQDFHYTDVWCPLNCSMLQSMAPQKKKKKKKNFTTTFDF